MCFCTKAEENREFQEIVRHERTEPSNKIHSQEFYLELDKWERENKIPHETDDKLMKMSKTYLNFDLDIELFKDIHDKLAFYLRDSKLSLFKTVHDSDYRYPIFKNALLTELFVLDIAINQLMKPINERFRDWNRSLWDLKCSSVRQFKPNRKVDFVHGLDNDRLSHFNRMLDFVYDDIDNLYRLEWSVVDDGESKLF